MCEWNHLSIEPFVELKLRGRSGSEFIFKGYQSNHSWNWNEIDTIEQFLPLHAINRTIRGIETTILKPTSWSEIYYQSNHSWNWNDFILSTRAILADPINRTIRGIETGLKHKIPPPALLLSIEPFVELKPVSVFRGQSFHQSYQSNHSWNWNKSLSLSVSGPLYSINRTIRGIETWKSSFVRLVRLRLSIEPFVELKQPMKTTALLILLPINRTIRGIETIQELTALAEAGPINRTIRGIET